MSEPIEPVRHRVIDLSVEVVGTPEEVWDAIATGPGISSWYVPTTVEEREGGATTTRFGEGPEMLIPGRVAAWDPPHRVRFVGAGSDDGLAFEWLVEARDGGTCIVRLVNSGFDGEQWDDQFDGMQQGWQLFLLNLQLHRRHFPGRRAVAMLPGAVRPGPQERALADLVAALGAAHPLAVGERVQLGGGDAPVLAGTVVESQPWRLALVVDEPCPGTAFLAAEGHGDQVGVSVWQYLYGAEAAATVARDEPRWNAWLAALT
jgi:uncharacterized protein YndB with AHSA1/START domain